MCSPRRRLVGPHMSTFVRLVGVLVVLPHANFQMYVSRVHNDEGFHSERVCRYRPNNAPSENELRWMYTRPPTEYDLSQPTLSLLSSAVSLLCSVSRRA